MGRPLRRLRGYARAHPALLCGVLLALLDLLLVYPAVLGGRVLAPEDSLLFNAPLDVVRPGGLLHPSNYLLTDAVEVFHPDLEWARGIVRAGGLPLWNPLIFGGWPTFASQQTATLYPLTWLAFVLPFWSSLGLIAVAKTLLGGLGTIWLCRRIGLGWAAALLAAVTFSLGSYFVIWLEHPQTNVYALIPWLLGAMDLVCVGRRARDCGVLAAVVGLCLLGGHPESAFIAGIACVAWGAFCLFHVNAGRERRRCLLLLTGSVGLGVAGGAVMLAAFAQLAGQAPKLARGGGAGAPDRSLLSFLMPDLWGRPDRVFQAGGPANYAERTAYVGLLPLMLAAIGLVRLRAGAHRFFLGLLIGALVLSIHVPVLTGAIDGLPGVSYVDVNRSLILVALCLAVLAGFGLERLLASAAASATTAGGSDGDDAGRGRRERRAVLAVGAAVGLVPVVWLLAHASAVSDFPRFSDIAPSLWGTARSRAQIGAAAATRELLFAVAAIGVLWGLARARRTAVGLAVALAAVDLLTLGHGYHPAIPESLAAPAPTPTIRLAASGQGTGRTLGYNEYLIPNVGSRYGLREPRGHGLPALGRYLALWNGLGGAGFQTTRLRPKDRQTAKLLDDFGVTQLLTSPHQPAPAEPGLRQVAHYADGRVYRNSDALSRAYVASAWRAVPDRGTALRQTLASTPAALRAAPVIEGVAGDGRPVAGGGKAGGVRFVTDGADTVSLSVDVHAQSGGYLVLLDSYYPGWVASVDGRKTAIHPANEAFRAVAVPPGRHTVVFRYRPTGLYVAGAVSAAAWLVILGLIVAPRLPRRRAAYA